MPTARLHKKTRTRGRAIAAPSRTPPRRPPAASSRIPRSATIRRQHVRCGRCPRWHGPYWYAFWEVEGRTRSAYIGSDAALSRLFASWGRDVDDVDDVDQGDELEAGQ
jgi:hypothetical protein